MDIAIIGTGNVGRALATSLTRAGHQVTLAARDEVKANAVAREVGALAAATPRDAASRSDVVILAVPFAATADVAREIAAVAADKIVVDASNPLKPDLSGLVNEGGESIAEQLVPLLPGAAVVKAFNTLFASVQADPTVLGETVDGFFATDDDSARRRIAELLESMSLRPVDAGALVNARALEAIAFLNIKLQVRHGGSWNSAFVMVAAPEAAIALPAAA